MFNLVKNELIKIFSKKAIYVILIIFLILSIARMALIKFIENFDFQNNYIDQEIAFMQENLKSVNKTTESGKEEYSYLQAQIEYLELQKKYGLDSWQATIVSEQLYDMIANINYYKNGLNQYVKEEDLSLEELQAEYEAIIKKLDEGDWKAFAEADLSKTKTELKDVENAIKGDLDTNTANSLKEQAESLKLKIQILQWRLEKDICYGDEDFDSLLSQYENHGLGLANYNYSYDINENNYKQKESKDFNYQEKIQYQNLLSEYNIAKYKIENNISAKQTASDTIQ